MVREQPKSRSHYKAFERLETRWADVDRYGHVNNVQYYSYFDTAVNRLLIERNVLDPVNGDYIGLVVETRCSYFQSLDFPVAIDVGVAVASIGTSSVRYDLAIFPGGSDVAAAQGDFVHVYVDRLTRRPQALASGLKSVLENL